MKTSATKALFGKCGFSLAEVIVASMLLAMIAGGILSVALSSRRVVTLFHQRHSGMEVAQAVVESFRKYLGYNYWNNSGYPIYPSGTQCYDLNQSDPLGIAAYFGGSAFATRNNATWCYRIENVPPYDYRKITVNVTWDEDYAQ